MDPAQILLTQNRAFPSLEYVLQGSIQDDSVHLLKARLQGLCDNITGEVEQFDDHEIVYTLRIPGASNVSLRVRYAIDDIPNPIYHLRYVASAELDKSQSVSVRQFHDCCVTKNIQAFLQDLGFAYDHEFFAKGDIFRKGRMKITVAKISTLAERNRSDMNPMAMRRPFTNSCFVEMSLIGSMHDDKVGDEMKSFSEQLKPLISLDKIDQKR
ncbi:unnamed protein product [Rotaria socialis]|uniref:Mediator of RNA polymerase II transcription subunit 18 n=2 Tax=Rotaria socialis TaxID=392032 RepID=A0A818HRK3_9BILA|nr:unnamed protein product [Rotaria socialis]CAF3343263.1 unnamed protein product [Rotaria socialis]CAF3483963.1 unnamed protein product [Rotaria socialis]CAF3512539.1 unnamed protein product [Rotaria socialis]CAF3752617.1 unnamed protein product [Rotaria socialis]